MHSVSKELSKIRKTKMEGQNLKYEGVHPILMEDVEDEAAFCEHVSYILQDDIAARREENDDVELNSDDCSSEDTESTTLSDTEDEVEAIRNNLPENPVIISDEYLGDAFVPLCNTIEELIENNYIELVKMVKNLENSIENKEIKDFFAKYYKK